MKFKTLVELKKSQSALDSSLKEKSRSLSLDFMQRLPLKKTFSMELWGFEAYITLILRWLCWYFVVSVDISLAMLALDI